MRGKVLISIRDGNTDFMKLTPFLIPTFVILATVGCATSSQTSGSGPAVVASKVSTAHLEAAYKNAAADQSALVNTVLSSLKSGANAAALTALQSLATIPGRTGEQEIAVREIITALGGK
jgi:hypothetical protein